MANLYVYNHGESDFLVKALIFLSGLKLKPEAGSQKPEAGSQKPEDEEHHYTHKTINQPVPITDEQIAIMADKCRYLLTIGEVNPIKWIGFARARHRRLYNATLEEYLMAENYYFAYIKTRETIHLQNLISVLYRYPWQRWDAEKIQSRAKKFAKVPQDVQSSVFMWYVGFRGYIPKRCPTLFKGTSSGEFNVRNYVNGIVHQLNGGNITQNNLLLSSPVWDALDELEQRAKENEEQLKIKN